VNDIFKVAAKLFQHIMTELNGAESKKDGIMTHKNCIKTHKARWLLEFMGSKYDCW
jgi:hypothetical protein